MVVVEGVQVGRLSLNLLPLLIELTLLLLRGGFLDVGVVANGVDRAASVQVCNPKTGISAVVYLSTSTSMQKLICRCS